MSEYPTGARLHPTGRLVPAALDEAMVRAVVEAFYARARRDDVVGPVFNRVIAAEEWPAHLSKITDFWSSMLLGTGRYMGRPMPKHIAIPELSDAHFQRWLTLFRMTVEEICPPEVAALFVERAETIGNNFRIRIAQFRGEDPRALKLMRAGADLAR
jgi:hemoglobin